MEASADWRGVRAAPAAYYCDGKAPTILDATKSFSPLGPPTYVDWEIADDD